MGADLEAPFKPVVVVTGFGPFYGNPVNASWEAVKLINKHEIEKTLNCELVVQEIPVTYEGVDQLVPALWENYSPRFMLHVGVSNISNCLNIEKQAHGIDYQLADILNKCPPNFACPVRGPNKIQTKLDIERICMELNANPCKDISVLPSEDAGRYLCEYIYYTSLYRDNSRTLFVHVPDLEYMPAEVSSRGLERILNQCLQ